MSYKALKQTVIPVLSTYPYINVWCAGCATGEEAYSIAILLKEAGLLKRTQIYATDINDKSLAVGKSGIYPLNKLDISSQNYLLAGGETDFSKYYMTKYNAFMMNKELRERILFSKHNLVSDGAFAEMHLCFAVMLVSILTTNFKWTFSICCIVALFAMDICLWE